MTQQQPRARRDDPTTSHEAAATVRNPERLRTRIHRIMATTGVWMTHEDVITAYRREAATNGWAPASTSGIRTRVSELHDQGYLEQDTAPTAVNRNGRRVHQWRYVANKDRQQRIRAAQGRARLNTGPTRYAVGDAGRNFLIVCPVGTVILDTHDGKALQRLDSGLWGSTRDNGDYMIFGSRATWRVYRVLYVPAGAATDTAINVYLDLPTTFTGD